MSVTESSHQLSPGALIPLRRALIAATPPGATPAEVAPAGLGRAGAQPAGTDPIIHRSGGCSATSTTVVPGPRRRARTVVPVVLLADAGAVALALVLGQLVVSLAGLGPTGPATAVLAYLPIVLLVMAGFGLHRGLRRRLVPSSFPDLGRLAHSAATSTLLLLVLRDQMAQTFGLARPSTRGVVAAGALFMVLVPLARTLARSLTGRDRPTRVLVIGSGVVADHVATRVVATTSLELVGIVDDNTPGHADSTVIDTSRLLGHLSDTGRLIEEHQVDRVVVAFSPVSEAAVADLLRPLADKVQISVVPRMFDLLTVRSSVDDLAGLPVVDVAPAELSLLARTCKRSIDLVVSAAALVALTPVLICIAAAVKLTSDGPVLFSQVRAGRNSKPFVIKKFRSMYVDAEERKVELAGANEVDGPLFKIREDPRITRVGRFLRRSSLDELPQLYNVLVGHMSLVGPRPLVTAEATAIDGWAARRYAVRPGLTGLWQISGRNDLPFEELCRIDYCYVASWSLWWDLRILWHTPGSVLRSRGAY